MNFDDYLARDVDAFWNDDAPEGFVDLNHIPNIEACADLLKEAMMALLIDNDAVAFATSLDQIADEFNEHGYQVPKIGDCGNIQNFANLTRCYAASLKKVK